MLGLDLSLTSRPVLQGTGGFALSFTPPLSSDVSFARASTGSYIDGSGVLQTAAIDEERFDHNLVGDPLGLLVEAARTNLLTYSNDFTNAAWTADGTSIVGGVADPFGGTSAATLSVLGGNQRFYQAVAAGASDAANSIWMRRRTGSGGISFWGADGVSVDVSSQVTTAWNRVAMNAGSEGSGYLMIILFGGADQVDIYGAQREAASSASSYIPTVASSVTRAAEVVSFEIPAGTGHLIYTFDDGSTQTVAVSPGAYQVPTDLDRPHIKRIAGTA